MQPLHSTELRNRRGQFKNRRGASFLKSWACSETTAQSSFPDLSALVTCNLCTRRSSEIEEANSKIEEVLAFSKAGLARKPRANLPFQTCPHLSHATSALDGAQKSKRPIQKSKRQAQKSNRHLAFPDASAPITRKLSFAEITGNLSKRRSQISKRRQFFSTASTPVTCTLSLAEITDNLSKTSDEEEKRVKPY
ncbi:hypothetical protein ACFX12_013614 [Malus domestica]